MMGESARSDVMRVVVLAVAASVLAVSANASELVGVNARRDFVGHLYVLKKEALSGQRHRVMTKVTVVKSKTTDVRKGESWMAAHLVDCEKPRVTTVNEKELAIDLTENEPAWAALEDYNLWYAICRGERMKFK
jgi:hypothetical protein